MRKSITLSLIMTLSISVVLLSGAIAVPILIRPFYYAHIDALNLEERTGLTEEEIKTAYNDI